MNSIPIQNILAKVEDQRIKILVYDQLLKDFSRAQLELKIYKNAKPDQWLEELNKVLMDLYLRDTSKLYQLLYLIDLPQEYYLEIKDMEQSEIGMYFAKLVLLRTLNKIAYRTRES